nr:MAG TPA: hypothetical protein [Caudoviricetes sp.]
MNFELSPLAILNCSIRNCKVQNNNSKFKNG